MNWQAVSFDWNHARAFLAAAETGSLSAAARALHTTQATVSRQVSALEQEIGAALFERTNRALISTQAGKDLLVHFRDMRDAAMRISLGAAARSEAVAGPVSITASEALSAYWLPPVLAELADLAPGIVVEIVASNEVRDLSRREADIAVRHVRPDQPELIARLAAESASHLCAATGYLDRIGRPSRPADLAQATFVGFSPARRLMYRLADMGFPVTEASYRYWTDNGATVCELVRQGLGIGVMTRELIAALPGVEPVLPEFFTRPSPIWLTTHRELHTSRRIRLVYDFLADAIVRSAAAARHSLGLPVVSTPPR
jgi:DNA-binding transcriptional LysR family regulator